MQSSFQNTYSFAAKMDVDDIISQFRNEFLIPVIENKEQIYFLGNSLGLQPKRTKMYINQVLEQWNRYGVEGFFIGELPWLEYHDQLIHPLAAIVGALPSEVVVMNSLTVNLHLLMVSFYKPQGNRKKILCEAKAFPSDQYMLETHIRQRGFDPSEILVELVPGEGEVNIHTDDILAAINKNKEELALVFLGGVNFYSGQVLDMEKIAFAAHLAGAKVGFDLAHAAGNIRMQLHNWDIDFAGWCSYKYLNSGPGAIAGTFIHQRYHNDNSIDRLAGWWGYDKSTRFLMQKGFIPISTAEGWQLSTPSPILYAAHKAALEIFQEAGLENIFEKGKIMTNYLMFILKDIKQRYNTYVNILTPEKEKGCQVSIMIPQKGKQVFHSLTKSGVFADWREPGVIRVAPVPLYNTYSEIWQFGQILEKSIEEMLMSAQEERH
jgi:kynureninase